MSETYEASTLPRPDPEAGEARRGMVINCAAYQGGRRVADIDLDQARVDTSDGRFVWIGLHEPDQPLLRVVQQRFGLHDLAIEDALCAHQRPKLEIYGDTLFIVVRTAALHDRKIRCGETHIFAGRGYVVTVRHGSTTAYKEVRARCEGAPKMLAMGEGFVVHSIMDFVVDNYFPILQDLENEVDALEDAIFSRTSDQLNIERIFEIRHELLLLRRAVQPLQEMCNRMMRFDVPLIDQVHASLLPRHSRPCDPSGREHRQPPRPSGGGAGGGFVALVGRAEQNHQDFFRRCCGANAADAGGLDLWHEFQKHSGTGMVARLLHGSRPDGDSGCVALPVLQVAEVAVKPAFEQELVIDIKTASSA